MRRAVLFAFLVSACSSSSSTSTPTGTPSDAAAPGSDGATAEPAGDDGGGGGDRCAGAAFVAVTETVALCADEFRIEADGEPFVGAPAMEISSDPGNATSTTLELRWDESGVQMRFFLYFRADATKWWSHEMRTYDGSPHGNWLYYKQGPYFESPLGTWYSVADALDLTSDDGNGRLHFRNLRLRAFLK